MDREVRLGDLAAPDADTPGLVAGVAPRVVVVGDVILDGWWQGAIERLCREAPVPVVELRERAEAAGGAANTAVNAAQLGGQVSLAGLVGEDAAGERLRALLVRAGVDTSALVAHPGTVTTRKSRVLAGDQILLRIDEQSGTPPAEALSALAARLPRLLRDADVVVVCDYGSGTLRGPVRDVLLGLRSPGTGSGSGSAGHEPLVIVDAHDPHAWRALRPDVATPNAAEAARLLDKTLDRALPPGQDRASVLALRRTALLKATKARCVLVTLDQDGTLALPESGPEHRTWARPAEEKRASGAGDTFVACLAVGLAAGLRLPTAQDLAQAAAEVVVRRPGTSVCTTADLKAHLGGLAATALDLEGLACRIRDHHAQGHRVVLTNGCFDVLHRGHTRYLELAKQLGDVLVVALNDDDSVRRLKGPERPINSAPDRAAVIAALSCVDYVTVFPTNTAVPLIEALRPHVYAKGGDYTPEMLPETDAVRAYGGTVAILDYVADHSTTDVIRRIRTAVPEADGSAGERPVVGGPP
ncbi:bifunctional protein HldE [Zafaria cholistanensis]|uniref:D-glycero-beta-D-manno-heptose 1-phosphate adenylyltransferase n=1 Tax=Zafaria cholistanensis TaxID=1682741 RepID=A0A5A7NSI1_9MICC|nr:D-glycero-beta-D-manno-heptose 1-phosphate adenylyltransferase [Zafaria cholistanensis]GER23112.1 bifunctional protein HldE [Zafaria cholistanensis]